MTRRRWLWLLGPLALVLLLVLALLDGRMTDTGGPGIVGFEFAWTSERAAEILAEWGPKGHDAALASLWLDYLYLAAYGAFLWLAILALRDAAAARGWVRFARPGGVVALVAVGGAAADAVEDAFLLLVLGGHLTSAGPPLAASFASLKFVCLVVSLGYLLGGLVALGVTRWRGGGAAASA